LSAVRAALALPAALAADEATRGLRLRLGAHLGPALTATVDEHLDYFGATARQALALPALAPPGGLALTAAVTAGPAVAALPPERDLAGNRPGPPLRGLSAGLVHGVCRPPDAGPPGR